MEVRRSSTEIQNKNIKARIGWQLLKGPKDQKYIFLAEHRLSGLPAAIGCLAIAIACCCCSMLPVYLLNK